MRSKDFDVGDLVYIKRKPLTVYSWHVKYPTTRFIGLVLNKIDGWSYSIVFIQIVHPDKGMSAWSGWHTAQRKKNYWDYDIFDLDKKVDLNKLNSNTYTKILSKLI